LSKIKQGGASLTTDRIILAELIANVQLDLSEQISQTQAQLEVKPLCTVKGNAEQLYQLFYNLIQNALKYQPKGNIPVIQISSQSIDNCCEITIEDNGLGFEQEQAEQIFGIFERLHGKNTYSGTGVGLAICKRIVDRHNGSIRAEGKLGEGARFIVRLPER
jgi:signal transduction histidine kinase